MKSNIPICALKRFQPSKTVVLLCLLCSLVMSACGSPSPLPMLTIFPSHPCNNLAPGESLALSVTGISGSDVTYSWSASAGNVTPTGNPTVTYTAPDLGGDVIIRVAVEKDGQAVKRGMKCPEIIGLKCPLFRDIRVQ